MISIGERDNNKDRERAVPGPAIDLLAIQQIDTRRKSKEQTIDTEQELPKEQPVRLHGGSEEQCGEEPW